MTKALHSSWQTKKNTNILPHYTIPNWTTASHTLRIFDKLSWLVYQLGSCSPTLKKCLYIHEYFTTELDNLVNHNFLQLMMNYVPAWCQRNFNHQRHQYYYPKGCLWQANIIEPKLDFKRMCRIISKSYFKYAQCLLPRSEASIGVGTS